MATARHPKATFFVQRQLFSGLTSFAGLEQKIATLPDEPSGGDAIEKYGVKKVFTFHRDVKSAQSFVSAGPEGVGTHLNGSAGFQPTGSSGVLAASLRNCGRGRPHNPPARCVRYVSNLPRQRFHVDRAPRARSHIPDEPEQLAVRIWAGVGWRYAI